MFVIFRKLFEPVIKEKKASLKMLAESTLNAFWYDLLPIFTLPYLTQLILDKNFSQVKILCLAIFAAYVFLWFVGFLIRKWDLEAKYIYQKYLNDNFRSKTIFKDNLSLESVGTGKVQSIIQKGFYSWADINWQFSYQIPRAIVVIFSGIYVMSSLGIYYCLLFIILIFISLVGYLYFKNIRLKYDDLLQEEENKYNESSVRVIMSRLEIVHADKAKAEIDNLGGYINRMKKIYGESGKYDFFSDLFISANGILLPFIGIFCVVEFSDLSSLEIPVITTFLYFSIRFSSMLYHVSYMLSVLWDQYPKVKKLWEFIDEIPEIKNFAKGNLFEHGSGSISFVNVGFNYAKEKILENFNLDIRGGEKIALVGHSGSGKTTIAKLLSGYMNPTSGKVLVDKQNLSEVSLKSYYKYVGYLTQEPMVFDGSIKENLLYAVSATPPSKGKIGEVTDIEDKIKNALVKANCDFVFKMKKGIQTQIGEKGIRLSGGERQRLAIAKLFLKNPEIIILDEPTSALDSFSEEKISQSLEELFKGRTTIIIAHRLQTVKKADRILVIENGRIAEEGNHENLVEKKGIYAAMLNMQSGF